MAPNPPRHERTPSMSSATLMTKLRGDVRANDTGGHAHAGGCCGGHGHSGADRVGAEADTPQQAPDPAGDPGLGAGHEQART